MHRNGTTATRPIAPSILPTPPPAIGQVDLLARPPTTLPAAAPKAPPLYIDLDEAARLLCVSRRTVERLIADGDLPHVKIGRRTLVRAAELSAWNAQR
jgi:excisionase family DNA binding protein